mmetsp:Transcript_17864/g.41713  ORF Transcript_17864/g.41713 Transcript_17864/m.41713 type:complete len:206 (-) Transcript_17864:530-1147(-)
MRLRWRRGPRTRWRTRSTGSTCGASREALGRIILRQTVTTTPSTTVVRPSAPSSTPRPPSPWACSAPARSGDPTGTLRGPWPPRTAATSTTPTAGGRRKCSSGLERTAAVPPSNPEASFGCPRAPSCPCCSTRTGRRSTTQTALGRYASGTSTTRRRWTTNRRRRRRRSYGPRLGSRSSGPGSTPRASSTPGPSRTGPTGPHPTS